MPDHLGIRPPRKSNLGHELRLQPAHIALLRRRILAAERTHLRRQLLERRQKLPRDFLTVPGADAPYVLEPPVAMHAREQRAQSAVVAGPTTEHHLMPGAALGFGPPT